MTNVRPIAFLTHDGTWGYHIPEWVRWSNESMDQHVNRMAALYPNYTLPNLGWNVLRADLLESGPYQFPTLKELAAAFIGHFAQGTLRDGDLPTECLELVLKHFRFPMQAGGASVMQSECLCRCPYIHWYPWRNPVQRVEWSYRKFQLTNNDIRMLLHHPVFPGSSNIGRLRITNAERVKFMPCLAIQ